MSIIPKAETFPATKLITSHLSAATITQLLLRAKDPEAAPLSPAATSFKKLLLLSILSYRGSNRALVAADLRKPFLKKQR